MKLNTKYESSPQKLLEEYLVFENPKGDDTTVHKLIGIDLLYGEGS